MQHANDMAEKEVAEDTSPKADEHVALSDADNLIQPGELSYAEVTAGGLGRHLGLFSTTFLMYVLSPRWRHAVGVSGVDGFVQRRQDYWNRHFHHSLEHY